MDKIDEDYVDLYNVAANKRTTFLHVIYPKSWTPPQHVSPHGGVIGRGNVEKTSDNVALRFSVPSIPAADENLFNVMDYGAKGDNTTDDTDAFKKAWADTCGSTDSSPTLLVPFGRTFLVKPTEFQGQCKSSSVNFQIMGDILAPDGPSAWEGIEPTLWLGFREVNGLSVSGSGRLDGRGNYWWSHKCNSFDNNEDCIKDAPTMLRFLACDDLQVSNLSFVNSPQMHLVIHGCQRVNVTDLRITSPATSPNTDGIHVDNSQHVGINQSTIATGDDCISIGDQTSDIYITGITCGPGHGISVGSLGKDGVSASVENIHVSNVNFYSTTNGARIKTWQGGKGFARSILFENINFTDVKNPVIIDQYYCDGSHNCPDKVCSSYHACIAPQRVF
ncbi:probable polygalacturonase At3g15720 [Ananas comosus]|uniref:Probable polygalacturonase At3g15720 n=1 Tax=Ananas comosus TaxID=4615 RepID=A0A6P5ENA1_ANACO|nr:probable polygalacturonase At3g15720 [Ananas comosus]